MCKQIKTRNYYTKQWRNCSCGKLYGYKPSDNICEQCGSEEEFKQVKVLIEETETCHSIVERFLGSPEQSVTQSIVEIDGSRVSPNIIHKQDYYYD